MLILRTPNTPAVSQFNLTKTAALMFLSTRQAGKMTPLKQIKATIRKVSSLHSMRTHDTTLITIRQSIISTVNY
jgi:hypothetical protein